jgi:hypothetical protein
LSRVDFNEEKVSGALRWQLEEDNRIEELKRSMIVNFTFLWLPVIPTLLGLVVESEKCFAQDVANA